MDNTADIELLLEDIRADQDITWCDSETERKLRNQVALGMAYLDNKLGCKGDYGVAGYPRTLLFEYVRYARAGALDVFEANYLSMILAMQNERKVEQYAAENTV